MTNFQEQVHRSAVQDAVNFRKSESSLITRLQEVEKYKVFQSLGYTSLFQYCVKELKLSESHCYQLIGIARKSQAVPELKVAVETGEISLSNARRIVSVITPENKNEWLDKAKNLPQRKLELELIRENPKEITKETIKPIANDRLELKVLITSDLESNLRKVQDLLSQKEKRPVTIEEAIQAIVQEYLKKKDPVQKAERANLRYVELCPGTVENSKRRPIPAAIKHQVVLRDQNQCSFKMPDGQRCDLKRWTHLHHIKPVSKGGLNEVNNLQTLCFYHHKLVHS